MVENGIYQLLRDDSGLQDVIDKRIYGGRLPKDAAYPAVVFQVPFAGDPAYSFQGANRFRVKRFQFDSYAEKYTDAVKASDAVREVLKSFSGTLSDQDSTLVNGCIVVGEMDFPYEPGGGSTGFVHRRMLEVEVQYTESE